MDFIRLATVISSIVLAGKGLFVAMLRFNALSTSFSSISQTEIHSAAVLISLLTVMLSKTDAAIL